MKPIKAFNQATDTTATYPALKRAEPRRLRARAVASGARYCFLTVAALLTLPLLAQAKITVWSSTLSVKSLGNNNGLGCALYAADGNCETALGNDTFTHYDRSHEFLIIALQPDGDLLVGFNLSLAATAQDLRLDVDGAVFAFDEASTPNPSSRRWTDSGLVVRHIKIFG